MNLPKRFLSLILCAASIISLCAFSSCEKKAKPQLSINNVDISDDVFTYFLDCAVVELGETADYKAVLEKSLTLADTYFKKNTLAHKEQLSLTTAEKAAVSEKVGAYWSIYGEYYEKIGISKETLTKVFTADSYRDALLMFYYGEGGSDEISVSKLYAQFKVNYIVFQSINGYFTVTDNNGQTAHLNSTETEAVVLKFQNMASLINAGEKTMDQAAEFLSSSGYTASVSTVVLKKDDDSYPAGFFEKLQKTEARRATVIGTTDYIFLVLRGDPSVTSDYYLDKREEMLKEIVGTDIDEKIESSVTTENSVSESNARAFYLLIKQEKEF